MTMNLKLEYSLGKDCRNAFRLAYENRYTYKESFPGYEGKCSFELNDLKVDANFSISREFIINIWDIKDENIKKLIHNQLFDVVIHRKYRDFESIHQNNSFNFGNFDDCGYEVIVTGKNNGDLYKLKENIITMVKRHIHGMNVTVYTLETFNTSQGYLSTNYSSEYLISKEDKKIKTKNNITDKFLYLEKGNIWVLKERIINTQVESQNNDSHRFIFEKLELFTG